MTHPGETPARTAAERVARQSYGKLVAFLAARTRDIAGAEDALSEAFAAALSQWPEAGVPASPEGWLLTVARRRLVDRSRQRGIHAAGAEHLALMAEEAGAVGPGHDIPDDRLRLMFACAHPAIDRQVRSALILQTVLGLDAEAIAAGALVAPATMGQRLVRAKGKIRQAGIAFRIPGRDEMPARLDAVLEAIYAAFTQGWSDPSGLDQHRSGLAAEAIWLGRLVATLLPDEPEALGLLALMLHLEARRQSRRDAAGDFVPLDRQDPALWDGALIRQAEDILLGASHKGRIGRYQLEAAVQSAHAVRRLGRPPDWPMLEQLYDALLAITRSPVVAVNRAMVLANTRGIEAGLAGLEEVAQDKRLRDYQPYWAARAELLARAGRTAEAREAYERAITLERDAGVRRYLERQLNSLSPHPEPRPTGPRVEGRRMAVGTRREQHHAASFDSAPAAPAQDEDEGGRGER